MEDIRIGDCLAGRRSFYMNHGWQSLDRIICPSPLIMC